MLAMQFFQALLQQSSHRSAFYLSMKLLKVPQYSSLDIERFNKLRQCFYSERKINFTSINKLFIEFIRKITIFHNAQSRFQIRFNFVEGIFLLLRNLQRCKFWRVFSLFRFFFFGKLLFLWCFFGRCSLFRWRLLQRA